MAHAQPVEETAEDKIVVDEAVALSLLAHNSRKRNLHSQEQPLELNDQVVGSDETQTASSTEQQSNGKKLLLHQSVSRWKPPLATMRGWIEHARSRPILRLPNTGCEIALSQPRTRRPQRTFSNPTLPPGRYPHNDGLTLAAAVLLTSGRLPQNEYDEASHMCGHGRCINPDHLVWEHIGRNSTRKLCHYYGVPCECSPPCLDFRHEDAQMIERVLEVERERKRRAKKKQKT